MEEQTRAGRSLIANPVAELSNLCRHSRKRYCRHHPLGRNELTQGKYGNMTGSSRRGFEQLCWSQCLDSGKAMANSASNEGCIRCWKPSDAHNLSLCYTQWRVYGGSCYVKETRRGNVVGNYGMEALDKVLVLLNGNGNETSQD